MHVVVKSYEWVQNGYEHREAVQVFVDGQSLGAVEFYGGEPEDNSRRRDYNWVEPLLLKLTEALGGEAELVTVNTDPWEEPPCKP